MIGMMNLIEKRKEVLSKKVEITKEKISIKRITLMMIINNRYSDYYEI